MGQFSWFAQDTKTQIFNDWDQHGDRQTIHMVDPRDGHDYKEEGYEGYGVFGGRDFYELLADINKNLILKLEFTDTPDTTIDTKAMMPDGTITDVKVKIPGRRIQEYSELEKLLNKKFEDLTPDDIDTKRQYGIDLWFDYIEPESWRPGKIIHELPEGMSCISPILVECYDKWVIYKDKYPHSDPDQGWHMQSEDDEEEDETWNN